MQQEIAICDCADEQNPSPKINFFCYAQNCTKSRRCCSDCKQAHANQNHPLIQLDKRKALQRLSSRQSLLIKKDDVIKMKVNNTLQRIEKIQEKLKVSYSQLISQFMKNLNEHLKKPLTWIEKSLGDQLKTEAKQIIYRKESNKIDLEEVAKQLRCINDEKSSKAEEINEICDNIEEELAQTHKNISQLIRDIMEKSLQKIRRLDPFNKFWKQDRLKRQSSVKSINMDKTAFEKKSSFFNNEPIQSQPLASQLLKTNPQATKIQLKNKLFGNIPKQLGISKNLKQLSLQKCQISVISNLQSFSILQKLQLNHNFIQKIQNLNKLKNLTQLQINGNQISKIQNLESLTKIQVLGLQSNRITIIQNLSHLINLVNIYLGSNQIKVIQGLDQCVELQIISLYSNQIQHIINFNQFPKLIHLYLANNPLKWTTQVPQILKKLYNRDVQCHQFDQNDFS